MEEAQEVSTRVDALFNVVAYLATYMELYDGGMGHVVWIRLRL